MISLNAVTVSRTLLSSLEAASSSRRLAVGASGMTDARSEGTTVCDSCLMLPCEAPVRQIGRNPCQMLPRWAGASSQTVARRRQLARDASVRKAGDTQSGRARSGWRSGTPRLLVLRGRACGLAKPIGKVDRAAPPGRAGELGPRSRQFQFQSSHTKYQSSSIGVATHSFSRFSWGWYPGSWTYENRSNAPARRSKIVVRGSADGR